MARVTLVIYCVLYSVLPGHAVSFTTEINPKDSNSGVFDSLPTEWNRLCQTTRPFTESSLLSTSPGEMQESLVQLSCSVKADDEQLVFAEFRKWSEKLNRKVALDISCDPGGQINLPWPMKAVNLVLLSVSGCTLLGYHSEYFSEELAKIPDELRVLEMKNLEILFSTSQLATTVRNLTEITESTECGPLTLEKFVKRNVTFQLDIHSDLSNLDDIDGLFEHLTTTFDKSNHTCNFRDLRYIDESYSTDLASKHFYLLTAKSLYPEVRVYNLSHCDLISVPRELTKWSTHFPKLFYLDLSDNKISDIRFAEFNKGLTTVDLRFNNITKLSKSDIRHLLTMNEMSFNLRHNPIVTNCGLNSDLRRVISLYGMMPAMINKGYGYLLDGSVTCHVENEQSSQKDEETRYAYIVIPIAVLCVLSVVIGLMIKRKNETKRTLRQDSTVSVQKLV